MDYFTLIANIVGIKENYIPKNYSPVEGLFTIETWEYHGVIYQVMDNGYTQRLYVAGVVDVTKSAKGELCFKEGHYELLRDVYMHLVR